VAMIAGSVDREAVVWCGARRDVHDRLRRVGAAEPFNNGVSGLRQCTIAKGGRRLPIERNARKKR